MRTQSAREVKKSHKTESQDRNSSSQGDKGGRWDKEVLRVADELSVQVLKSPKGLHMSKSW